MPMDLSKYPLWQKLVNERPEYHKAWMEGRFPPIGEQWHAGMPSRGLGDTIAKITHATGLDRVAKKLARMSGKSDCGCDGRQARLNELFPYSVKP